MSSTIDVKPGDKCEGTLTWSAAKSAMVMTVSANGKTVTSPIKVPVKTEGIQTDLWFVVGELSLSLSLNMLVCTFVVDTLLSMTRCSTHPFPPAEHQPNSCSEYPASGSITFDSVQVTWADGHSPKWEAHTFQDACNCAGVIVDPETLKFTWDTKATTTPSNASAHWKIQ